MKKLCNKLTAEYDQLFLKNVLKFKAKCERNKTYAAFYPSLGTTESERAEFLIYGQAVKNWQPTFNSSEKLNETKFLEEAIQYSNDRYKDKNHSPLDWINVYWSKAGYSKFITTAAETDFYPPMTYTTSHSFFWNVTYKLVCRYYNIDENSWDWAKKIVWSNLYKIAPEMRNPNDEERLWQEVHSAALIKEELDHINPKFCIVVTNDSWWRPFRTKLKTKILPEYTGIKDGVIESIEEYRNSKIIVTTRPFMGDSDNHVNKILSNIK